MNKTFKKTVLMDGMIVDRIEMSFTPGDPDRYALMISISNPNSGARETIDIDSTQFPAITAIIQNAFETAENKLVNWSQNRLEEDTGE